MENSFSIVANLLSVSHLTIFKLKINPISFLEKSME